MLKNKKITKIEEGYAYGTLTDEGYKIVKTPVIGGEYIVIPVVSGG